jgi:hypothetical protein
MLVLKRKSLQTAIDNLTKQMADGETDAQKAKKVQMEKFVKAYTDGFALLEKELAKAYADFAKVQKELPKLTFEEAVEKLGNITTTSFQLRDTNTWSYRNAVKQYSANDSEKKLTTLKGLLALMEGPELQLTNTLAEKFLGKMDILGLLS